MRVLASILLVFGIATAAVGQVEGISDTPDRTFLTADGQEVRQYELNVMAVGRRHITVQFTDGTRHTYRVPDDFRFNIEGTPTPLSGIYPRQRLNAYFYYEGGAWRLA